MLITPEDVVSEFLFYLQGDRRRKQAESQLAEVQAKLSEVDRIRAELAEKSQKLQSESESIAMQLEEAELK